MKLLEKIFGTYSGREIKKITPLVDKIELIEEDLKKLSDEQLRGKTAGFKERLKNGETLDDILPEAYATVAEASSRVLGMRHFRVQLIGGIIIHQGRIAEMKTGEGKTLVATLPVYLNALSGKGVHVVTVNDYLAKRDSVWMGKLYNFLGLTVGLVVPNMSPDEKRAAYNADITYGTNNEFGFDYLRDNMTMDKASMVQRDLNFAIVDEIDSILIDEARTPLIISGNVNKQSDLYKQANAFAKTLKPRKIVENNDKEFDESDEDYDYIVDLKAHTVALTNTGTKKAEKFFGIESLSDVSNLTVSHHVNQALRAYGLMHRDKDYIVRDGKVLIVDEFTGRIMDGRRYSDGLHQAIEAKENVTIANESQTLATITFQNYFRLYNKLAGMTGTAKTEEEEFKGIYKLDIVEIPTNRPVKRIDHNDVVYKNQNGKFNAIVKEVAESYEKGQPVLVGTVSIDKSELISNLLKRMKIPHQVLNAKFHEKEAEIIAQAGKYKAVTIATNMAGRGTDIMLGGNLEFIVKSELAKKGYTPEEIELAITPIPNEDPRIIQAKKDMKEIEDKYRPEIMKEKEKVIAAGGLRIIGSERHESRRIDNQLRGRSGRQGDPGESRFYIAMDDDLMKLFGSDKMTAIVDALGLPEDMPIEQKMLTNTIESAQKKVEGRNYSIRKNVLEYDDVMNQQREIIYSQRRDVIASENIFDIVKKLYTGILNHIADEYFEDADNIESVDYNAVNAVLKNLFGEDEIVSKEDIKSLDEEYVTELLISKVDAIYEKRVEEAKKLNIEAEFNRIAKYLVLNTVNHKWMDHIDAITALKEGIGLRAYAQTNPLEAYKMESYNMFEDLVRSIREESVKAVFSLKPKKKEEVVNVKVQNQVTNMYTNAGGEDTPKRKPVVKKEQKVGRNDPCPCGSGKKYKNCCGKNS
ncbi:MAG: preprotein translocase subunit SecA [Clostridia bacterium]|nr:preprotein translocase subunit SecA [Clostridia bacterium]